MLNNPSNDLEPGSASHSKQNLRILFLPFVIFLSALILFRFFSERSLPEAHRSPSSIPEVEAITVPTALKTVLKISGTDFDRSTTTRVQKELTAGVIPQFLQKCSPVILEKLKNGEMRFYTFRVLDSIDDDGDQVEVLIDGQVYADVVLSRSETPLLIPIEYGKSKILTIKAVRDSGNGISFGAKLLQSEFLLDNLKLGETDSIYFGFTK